MASSSGSASMTGSSMSSEDQQVILNQFQTLRQECLNLHSKIQELEMDRAEHDLVLSSLTGLEASRKAYRMVGGVLLERTVGEVVPAVSGNKDQIAELIAQLEQALKRRDAELGEFTRKHNIRVKA
eukprot:ANDGO_02600.mRNA.1 putative prefoldin subunit 2